jgi:two-component system, cell cycle response regulator
MELISNTENRKDNNFNGKRSVLRNLFFSMLAFGLFVGLLFPPFARIVLKTDRAYSPIFISMCIGAGLLVGIFNFFIFRRTVSKELSLIQKGMHHVNENIAIVEILEDDCLEECTLDINSADIIGEISTSFNYMTNEIFKRLMLESEARTLNTNLSHNVELDDVSKTILKSLSTAVESKAGLLYRGRENKLELLTHIGIDHTDEITSISAAKFGPIKKALDTGTILTYTQLDGWEWLGQSTPLGGFKPGSILLIPLMTKQQPVGVVILACGNTPTSPQQLKTLETLRNSAAPYFESSILHNKLTQLAAIDELTNILNRRFGLKRLKEEFSRSARHGLPISAVMVDIDHFKNFNDTFGHDAGDAVLKMVAEKISETLRAEDMVCRYGGEEFLISLSGAGMNDSAIFTERIRRTIETNFVNWGEQQLSVTISCGVATYPVIRASVCEELITAADKALYAAKEYGRNQVALNDGAKILRFSEIKSKE